MHSFEYQAKTIKYQLIKSKRKTLTITILPTKEVVVKAPRILSDQEIMRMVMQKGKWITDKISKMEDLSCEVEQRYMDGAEIFYRGKKYRLKIIEDYNVRKSEIQLRHDEIVVIMKHKKVQLVPELMEGWYKERIKELIYDKIEYYNSFINKKISNIRIKNHKKRWGSCSNLGNLNFNWRIIMMPDEMFDYIVVHELCHLIHMNHSKEYWKSVEMILPDYKEREKWIRQNGSKLLLY